MRRARPEDDIQCALLAHIAARSVSDTYVFAVPNGGARSVIEAKIMAGLGTHPGTSDLFLIHRGQVFAIELKSESGRATAAQLRAIKDIRRDGGHAEVCHGPDRALAQPEAWGLLRGGVQ
jgi:hypothetical protein